MELEIKQMRPIISKYAKVEDYIRDQVQYLKRTEPGFSILNSCKKLRRVSPSLVTLIINGKRKLTFDRVEEFAKLLQLTVSEKIFLRDWTERKELNFIEQDIEKTSIQRRKEVSLNILNDWLNVYVKDCFQLEEVQKNPKLVYSRLAHIAEPKRIDKSIQFLLREGYLRKTLDQKIVIETSLAVVETPVPSVKIRQFHKAALNIARNGIDTVAMDQRYVNTLVWPLNQKQYAQFVELIQEFTEKTQKFLVDLDTTQAESLYQFNLNLIPTGRKEV